MSKIEVDTIDTQSSTTLQVGSTNTALIKIGTSGDTVEYPTGTTFTQSGTQNVTSGGAINVKSGGNITIDSGATITNNGTATGFSADLTNLNATNLTSGTVPDARFPATLPIANGSALTNLNATNLGSGTVPDARFPATLPAISGANLTNLPVSGASDSFQAVGGGGSATHSGNLIANTELHDDGGNYDTSTGRYTAPTTGYYLFMAGCLVSGSAGQNFYLTKQNSAITSATSWGYNGTGNQNASNVYGIVYLTAGQYAGIYSTTSVYTNQYLYFGGCKLY